MPIYTLEAMLNVVEDYRRRRQQPLCPNCAYVLFKEMEDSTVCPPDFEEMREQPAYIRQCQEHDVPEYPWLRVVDPELAATWLVEYGNGLEGMPFQIPTIMGYWERDCMREHERLAALAADETADPKTEETV